MSFGGLVFLLVLVGSSSPSSSRTTSSSGCASGPRGVVGHRRAAQASHRPGAEPGRDLKGYAAHERGTARQASARRAAMAAQTGGAGAGREQLTGALRQLFALAESYPDLKAKPRASGAPRPRSAHRGDDPEGSRRYYNAVVRASTPTVTAFPLQPDRAVLPLRQRTYSTRPPEDRQVRAVSFGS